MIVNVDSKPEDNIYYIAGMLIKILKNNSYSIIDLYKEYQKNNRTSFCLYILSIDWLQLIGIIEIKDNRCIIIKC